MLARLGELGAQLAEIRQAASGNAAQIEQLRRDLDQLRQEVTSLKRLSSEGSAGLPVQSPELQPGLVITAVELAEAYSKNSVAADNEYRDNFLTVVGRVDTFTTGSTEGDIMIQMRTGEGLPRVKFFF